MQRPFNVVLVFSRLNLLLVPLISVMLDCCEDDSLKMSVVFCWEWGNQEAFTDFFVFGCRLCLNKIL